MALLSNDSDAEKKNNSKESELRQDTLKGNKPEFTEDILYFSNDATYNAHKAYENLYLTKLLIVSHALNGTFQNSVKSIAKKYFQNSFNCIFQEAPVKLIERCLIKSQTEYGDARWPRSARVVDLIRNSLTFENCNDLLYAMNKFISLV